MLNKQIIDIFELLDDPKANGQVVKAFLQAIDPEVSVETYALEGPQGKTDMVKAAASPALRERPLAAAIRPLASWAA